MGQARDVLDKLTDTAVEMHDVDKAVSLYADNAVVMTPDAGPVKGRMKIAEYWHQFIDGFPDSHYESIAKLESNGRAVDEGYFIGTHTGELTMPSGETLPATGKKVKLRSCDIATVENGKITEHHLYFDESEFMRQLGLSN
ncbi:ester cyclase [Glycomyces luteolus]|uniref:Ester cyclase n=1 Tax=Glycomyces luteolus TaxID=2670330 RepID=A0A9X3PAP7_9ACTN|nr:ester cyclase [Glycomyces luteolus]MDA1360182.1 ester cyclase [Glycomyces luteolus]